MTSKPIKSCALALLLASLAGVALSASDGSSLFGGYFHDSSCSTPYALAAHSYNLQTMAAAIKAAGLVDVLDTTSSEITVFAPTDDAFAALAEALHMTPEELLAESNLLSVILEYHVYAKAAYEASDLEKQDTLVTKEGETVEVKSIGDIVTLEPAAGSTATVLVADLTACKAVVHIIDTILIPKAAATALGLESIAVKGAHQEKSHAMPGILSKKIAGTPVPTETVIVPVTTAPAVAVSGARVASPTPVPTVPVAKTPANTEKPKLFGGLLPKKTLNTFPTPKPTPKETPAPTHPTLKELLVSKAPAVTPVRTVLVPVITTVPAVAVSGARDVPMATPVAVPAAPAVVTKAPVAEKPLDGLLKKKELVWNTFTPAATQKATPKPSVPALKKLLLKETPAPEKKMPIVIGEGLFNKPTPVPTILVPVAPVPAVTVPAVPVSGARAFASPPVVEVPVSTVVSKSPEAQFVEVMPIREAIAPAVARVGAAVGSAIEERREAVAPARAAVAQAATDIMDRRRDMLSPAVEALDGPAVNTAMAPEMMPMAPMMAPMTAPVAAMAPAVEALQGPETTMMESQGPMMAPMMAPQTAPHTATAPETAPEAAVAPAVVAQAGPNTMNAPAMAPGMGGLGALDALKTRSSSPCTTVLEAAMMVPELSTFVSTAQAANLSDYLRDPSLVATVFAPTNDAFSKALSQYGVTPSQALQQASLVRGLLQYHVVPGMALTVDTLANGQTLTTALSGQTLKVNKTGGSATIQPATGSAANLVEADVLVCKATLHVIDSLLFASVSSLPPSAAGQLAARTAGR